MPPAYIALGSNLGKRQLALRTAIERLGQLPGTRVIAVAGFRETAPVGGPPGQGAYINSAAAIETELPPRQLLDALLNIEKQLGRDRSSEVRNGPRTCDMDLLLYGDAIFDEPGLTVPHPRLHQRAFVLEPLAEIAPQTRHPVFQRSIQSLLEALPPTWEIATALGTLPIARARPDDLETVRLLLVNASEWLESRGIRQWLDFRDARGVARLQRRLAQEDVYLAMHEKRAVASVTVDWQPMPLWQGLGGPGSPGYLHGLVVHRAAAGDGIGLALLQWAEQVLAAHGRTLARLDCVADNPGILNFYRRAGYEEHGVADHGPSRVMLFEKRLQRAG